MRFAYVDEAGISNRAQEPFAVVAGVIVHADLQWKMLEKYIRDMVDEHVPSEKRDGFVFHATELYSGGKTFDRQTWPKDRRWAILDELVSIPAKFDMPVVWGFVDRAEFATRFKDASPTDLAIAEQTVAYSVCLAVIEDYMRRGAEVNEVATVIVENNHVARKLIRATHNFLRDPTNAQYLPAIHNSRHLFPVTRIVDTAFFAEKIDSSPLQIADACAFAIKRHLMGANDSARFYEPLVKCMNALPKSGLPKLSSTS